MKFNQINTNERLKSSVSIIQHFKSTTSKRFSQMSLEKFSERDLRFWLGVLIGSWVLSDGKSQISGPDLILLSFYVPNKEIQQPLRQNQTSHFTLPCDDFVQIRRPKSTETAEKLDNTMIWIFDPKWKIRIQDPWISDQSQSVENTIFTIINSELKTLWSTREQNNRIRLPKIISYSEFVAKWKQYEGKEKLMEFRFITYNIDFLQYSCAVVLQSERDQIY